VERLIVVGVLALAALGCAKKPPPPPPTPEIVVEGRVVWSDGGPAEGVTVQGYRSGNEQPCRTTSSSGGAFRVSCPGVDWVRLVAIPQNPGGHIELVPDLARYTPRPEPWRGVELYAPRPKPSAQ
jgi:hypothetical protein